MNAKWLGLFSAGRAQAVVSGPGIAHKLEDSRSPGWDEVGDDERGREEEQAEDEVPDEAVALAASDPGGPERDHDPDESTQDPPQDRHDISSSRSVRNAATCCRT